MGHDLHKIKLVSEGQARLDQCLLESQLGLAVNGPACVSFCFPVFQQLLKTLTHYHVSIRQNRKKIKKS